MKGPGPSSNVRATTLLPAVAAPPGAWYVVNDGCPFGAAPDPDAPRADAVPSTVTAPSTAHSALRTRALMASFYLTPRLAHQGQRSPPPRGRDLVPYGGPAPAADTGT